MKLPERWKSDFLGNIAKWGSGGTPKKSHSEYYDGEIKWAIIGDLNGSTLNETKNKITKMGLENSSVKLIPTNTLLIGMYGSIGKTAITGCEMCTNQAIAFAIPKKDMVDLYFLKYFIEINVGEFFKLSKGGTQKNISQEVLKKFKIPIPTIKEQKLIVQEIEKQFSRLDESVNSLKSLKEKLQIYRKSVLKAAFEGHFTNNKVQRVKVNINGCEVTIPKTWYVNKLGEYIKLQGGFAFKSKEYSNTGIPIVKISNVNYGNIDWTDKTFIDSSRYAEFKDFQLKKDDILIAMTRPIIKSLNSVKTVKVKEKDLPALLNQRVGRFIIKKTITKRYLQNFIYTEFFRLRVLNESSSSQQPNISSKKIENFDLIVPSSEKEQHLICDEIESRFSVIDKLEETVEKSLEKTEKLRKSILKSAFEGKLVKYEAG